MAAKKGHERGTAHEFTREEARIAGRKGGLARAQNRAKSIDRNDDSASQNEGGREMDSQTSAAESIEAMRSAVSGAPATQGM